MVERAQQVGMLGPVRDTISYLHREFAGQVPEKTVSRLAGASTTEEDQRRYRQLSRSDRSGSFRNMMATHWWRYRAGCDSTQRRRSLLGFTRYLFAYGRHRYRCRSIAGIARGIVISLGQATNDGLPNTETTNQAAETTQPRQAA